MIETEMVDEAIELLEQGLNEDYVRGEIERMWSINSYDAQSVVEMATDAISEG